MLADLLALLGGVGGTYGAEHAGSRRLAYVLNSDVADGEYPYYLLSCEQILASGRRVDLDGESIADSYGDGWGEWLPPGREAAAPGEGHLLDRIDPHLPEGRRLHFADCMNNGARRALPRLRPGRGRDARSGGGRPARRVVDHVAGVGATQGPSDEHAPRALIRLSTAVRARAPTPLD